MTSWHWQGCGAPGHAIRTLSRSHRRPSRRLRAQDQRERESKARRGVSNRMGHNKKRPERRGDWAMYINTHSSHRIRRSVLRGRSHRASGRSRRRRLQTHKHTQGVRTRAFCAFVDGRRRTVVVVSAVSAVAAVAARGHAADGAAAVAPVRAAVAAVCAKGRQRQRAW